jgi:hypothetical protein
MGKKSLISEVKETQLAIELIKVGARLQVLESETSLSRERLLKLYKEVKGVSPPKGMLPFSADWFLTWMPNVHASLFINIYRTISKHTDCEGIEAVLKSYRLASRVPGPWYGFSKAACCRPPSAANAEVISLCTPMTCMTITSVVCAICLRVPEKPRRPRWKRPLCRPIPFHTPSVSRSRNR